MKVNLRILICLLMGLFFVLGGGVQAEKLTDFTYSYLPGSDPSVSDSACKKLNDGDASPADWTMIRGGVDGGEIILLLDLKTYTRVDMINIWIWDDENNQHVDRFEVFPSDDGTNFSATPAYTVNNPDNLVSRVYPFGRGDLNLVARYLKIVTYGGTNEQQAISEIEIFGESLCLRTDKRSFAPSAGETLTITSRTAPSTLVSLEITTENNNLVKTLLTQGVGGDLTLTWDGRDADGNLVPDGSYFLNGTFDDNGLTFTKSLLLMVDATMVGATRKITDLTYTYPDEPGQDPALLTWGQDPNYTMLTDGGFGSLYGGWNSGKDFIVLFDLKRGYEIQKISIGTSEEAPHHHIKGFRVSTSMDGVNFSSPLTFYNSMPKWLYKNEGEPKRQYFFSVENLDLEARYVKITTFYEGNSQLLDEVTFWGEPLPLLRTDRVSLAPALGQQIIISYETMPGNVSVNVLDQNKQIVRTLQDGASLANALLRWDGKNAAEKYVADGTYTIQASFPDGAILTENVEVDNTGPAEVQLITPHLPEDRVLYHNRDFVVLTGKVSEKATVKVYRVEGGQDNEVGSVESDIMGNFILNAPLAEGINVLKVMAFDSCGNPSEPLAAFTVNYDPARSIGIPQVENGTLLSPKNQDGIKDSLSISFYMKPAGTAFLRVVNAAGQLVFAHEKQTAGDEEISLNWDGKAENEYVADGNYTYILLVNVGGQEQEFLRETIRVDNTPPLKPLLQYPGPGANITDVRPVLRWEEVTDADYYLVYYSQNADLANANSEQVQGNTLQLGPLAKGTYYWQVKAVDAAGNLTASEIGQFTLTDPKNEFNITNFSLTPNPFTPNRDGRRDELAIGFTLQQAGNVKIAIYNLAGKLVKEFKLGELAASDYLVVWDGRDNQGELVKQGTYILRLTAKNPHYGPVATVVQPILVWR